MFVLAHRKSLPSRRASKRAGAAAVEFAVCLPMLAAMVFGAIEASNAVALQQALTTAAYEAGNVAAAMDGNSSDAITRANTVLTALGIKSATVTVSPTVTPDTPVGTTIVVTCSAPMGSNSTTNWCLSNTTRTAKFTMSRL